MSNQKKAETREFSVSARTKQSSPLPSKDETLDQLLGQIATQIEQADQRHSNVLRGMHQSVKELGEQARETESSVSDTFAEDFERLQHRLNELAIQIKNSAGNNEQTSRSNAPYTTSDFEPVNDDDHDNPWDKDSADALLNVYESADGPYALRAMHASMVASSNADRAWLEKKLGGLEAQITDALSQERPNMDAASERAWLEEKFSEIASKVERSLTELSKSEALEGLRQRFEDFQAEVSESIQGIALRSDLEGLKAVEKQIDALKQHFEEVQKQFGRIETMESQISTIMDRVSDERLGDLLAENATAPDDFVELAATAAEDVAQRMAISQTDAEQPSSGIDNVLEAIEAFKEEQRKVDDQTANMLDTMQLAMINVLDRIEVMEKSGPITPSAASSKKTPAPATPTSAPEADSDETLLPIADPLSSLPPSTDADAAAYGFEPIADQGYGSRTSDLSDYNELVDTPESLTNKPFVNDELDEGFAPKSDLNREQQHQAEDEQSTRLGAIERIREQFVAEAQRARDLAAQNSATTDVDDALSELTNKSEANHNPDAPRPSDVGPVSNLRKKFPGIELTAPAEDEKAAGEEQKIFGISRRNLLIGAIILLVATSALLFFMPRKKSGPPPKVIRQEQPIKSPAPGATQPQTGKDGGTTTPTPGGRPSNNNSDPGQPGAPSGSDSKGPQGSSAPGDGAFNKSPDPYGSARLNPAKVEGITMYAAPTPASPQAIAHYAERHRMANLSTQLGSTVVKTSPAAFLPQNDSQSLSTTVNSSIGSSNLRSQLNLPPATLGPLSLRLAAAKGDPSAQFEVAARLASGKGANQDFAAAANWYQRSASQGFAQAQYRLGTLYERGLGLTKDESRARIWYQRAAEQSNIKAMHNLAVLSASSATGSPNYATAAKWFKKAADYGLADSQFNLAVLYENGLGAAKDMKMAYKYYALAAKSGDKDASIRRDAIMSKLSQADLTVAQRSVSSFRPLRTDKLVNDPRYAGQAWRNRASTN